MSRLVALLLLATVACAPGDGPDSTTGESDAAQLAAVADAVWERTLETSIYARLWSGLPFESLPDLSYEEAERATDFARSVMARLDAIDETALDHDDWITWAVLARQAEMTIEGFQYYWYSNVLTPYSSAVASLRQIFGAMPLTSQEELDNYLALLGQVPGYVNEVEMLARGNVESGFAVSAANMPAVTGLVRASIQPADAGMFAVATERVGQELGEEAAEVFRGEVARIVEQQINPALTQLSEYLESDYLAAAPAGVGLSQYELGDDYYRYLVRLMTTMEVTPEAVRAIGHEMIDEMKAEMSSIQAELGFEGTFQEFKEHIQTTPDYYPTSPDQVKAMIEDAADAFFERRFEFFDRVPEAPFGARRLDPSLEASQTYGYYNPPTGDDPAGYYNFNGSRLDERAWINLKGLAYHELFPGHHFQITRVLEDEELHPVRRATMHTAYTEGWGSYSTFLGLEQGMIEEPISQYGIYMMEIFLANRLVLDPGMNAMGMSLDEAREFMRHNTFESDTQIATETLRYSTDMPGQALGYQMGKREILRLRQHAMDELGGEFDLKAFHEAVLSPGSLPMTVLADHIDWWIEQQRGGK